MTRLPREDDTPVAARFSVPAHDDGMRLDAFLSRAVSELSRARAIEAIESGNARLNGRRTKKGARVSTGDRVTLASLPEARDFVPEPWHDAPIDVLYEDAELVAIQKPRGVPTHPLSRGERETAAQALLGRYPEMAGVGYALREPGILHRLDTDTSGVLLAARSEAAFVRLVHEQRQGAWQKSYVALVEGAPRAPDVIEAGISPDRTDPRRVLVDLDAPRRTTTVVATEVLGALVLDDGARVHVSAVTLRVEKATRHQIRAHLAYYGHPLLADVAYGGAPLGGACSHWLHASEVVLPRPQGAPLTIAAPWPPAMRALADEARAAL